MRKIAGETIREALKHYFNTKKSKRILLKLEELQAKNAVKTSAETEVKLIRDDRNRW